jgi:hypothetical protein
MEYTNVLTGARVVVDMPTGASAIIYDRAFYAALDILKHVNSPIYSEVGLNQLLDP